MRVATVAALVAAFVIAALASGVRAQPAGFHEDYSHEARLNFASYFGVGNRFGAGYRRYFDEIVEEDRPYRLQPFTQRVTYLEGALAFGPGRAWLFDLGGRYVFPDTPFGALAEVGFGNALVDPAIEDYEGLIFGRLGFDFYLGARSTKLAVEARVELGDLGGAYNRLEAGLRSVLNIVSAGDTIEIYAGYRGLSFENKSDLSEALVEVRYFFDKRVFVGLEFTTDTGRLGFSGGYNTASGLVAEIELSTGPEELDDFFSLTIGLQF